MNGIKSNELAIEGKLQAEMDPLPEEFLTAAVVVDSSMSPPDSIFMFNEMGSSRIEYIAGLGAGVASVLMTFPLNKISFRQSLWGFHFMDAWRQLSVEGTVSLFRGALPPVLIKSINSSVMSGTFNQYRNLLQTHPSLSESMSVHPLGCTFLAAMMGGCTEALLTPLERVQMILQDDRNNAQYRNTVDAFLRLRRYGIGEYYRGLSAVLLRNGPSTFLYFGFKDTLKDRVLPDDGLLLHQMDSGLRKEALRNFLAGGTMGSFTSTLFYPINVLRIQMQTAEVGTERMSLYATGKALYEERGGKMRLMMAGMGAHVTRSFVFWGFWSTVNELLCDYLHHQLQV